MALGYFQRLGFKLPQNANPADFFMVRPILLDLSHSCAVCVVLILWSVSCSDVLVRMSFRATFRARASRISRTRFAFPSSLRVAF